MQYIQIMKALKLLLILLVIAACNSPKSATSSKSETVNNSDKPNILLITLDDMNWDSPASFGGYILDLTPHIDGLAKRGVQFNNAYVQAPNCSPSRVVIQTGLYPHQSGMRGFYFVENNIETLSGILKENGYYTGVLNKKADSSIHPDYDAFWDEHSSFPGIEKRSAKVYGNQFENFLKSAEKSDQPYYCVVNIADPHKPFFNDPQSKEKGFDKFKPSKIYTYNDVKVPEFLPETPEIKQQVLNYVNSVRRGDDCIGEVLRVLNTSKNMENTIVVLLSDHGMPFPYAKSTVYQNGLKTPMIVSWPKQISAKEENDQLVSAIDIAPTLLDIAGIEKPAYMSGTSFYQVLNTVSPQDETPYVFGQYDENAGGVPRPSRTAISKQYGYVFNPWATGNYKFISASTHQPAYKQMRRMADVNEDIKKRFNFWIYRTVEEFYDYQNDPNAMHNLIDHPDYQNEIKQHRKALLSHMQSTKDYALVAFENRDNTTFLNQWMEKEIEEANWRSKNIKWKRWKNHMGKTKGNTQFYNVTK